MIRRLSHWMRDENAAIAPLLALLLVPILGMVALGGEVAYWHTLQRQLQNVADAAAIAAATNNTTTLIGGVESYKNEAIGVAGQYGYVDGANTVTISTVKGTTSGACGGVTTVCYKVSVSQKIPLYMTQIVGFHGNTTYSDGRQANLINAVAIAKPRNPGTNYCMMSLGGGNSLRVNGGPNVDLDGCDMKSNGNLVCNGANSDTGVVYGDAVGTSGCGETERSSQPASTDPFEALNTNPPIPTTPSCTTPTQWTSVTVVTTAAELATPRCGTVKLGNDITVTSDTTLSIYMGTLDLNGHFLKTSGNAGMTIIFTGESVSGGSNTYQHYPTSSVNNAGGIEIQAPTSGTLKGIALMQDKRLTGNKNDLHLNYSGNGPSLALNGLVYFPNGDFDISGAINHATTNTTNLSCIGVIAKNILVSGTGSIFDNTLDDPTKDCGGFLALPTIPGSNSRQALVQ
jgi:Flp pilus assembly protein TadG